jgi:hypothetical protein
MIHLLSQIAMKGAYMARQTKVGKKPTGIWTNDDFKNKAKKIGQKISGVPSASAGFNYAVMQVYQQLFEK